MNLSETELMILTYLWEQEVPKSFSEIMEYFSMQENKQWKKQTLNTFLLRLTNKGFLQAKKEKNKAYYSPVITSEEYYQRYTKEILDDSFHSSLKEFVCAFTTNQKLSTEEKEELLEYLKGL